MCSQGVTRDVWIAMGVHLGCYVGCVDSHGCTLRDSHGCTLRRDVWIAMGVFSGCYKGCVDSHGCTLRGMCG